MNVEIICQVCRAPKPCATRRVSYRSLDVTDIIDLVVLNDPGKAYMGFFANRFSQVPEASSWVMMLSGFVGLALAGYLRRTHGLTYSFLHTYRKPPLRSFTLPGGAPGGRGCSSSGR